MGWFVSIILLAGVIYLLYSRESDRQKRKKGYEHYKNTDTANTENQLRFVSTASFEKRKIMSKEAFNVFKTIENYFQSKNDGYRVIPEVCLGAVLSSENKQAHSSINSKRIDIGVIDRYGKLFLAVEYHGSGHY